MKILLANLHFWPDTPPHAVILKYIAEALADNNDVIVIAAQPCYKKKYKVSLQPKVVNMQAGYEVHRINLGLENTGNIFNKFKVFFGYAIFLFYKIIKEKPQRTVIGTNPPILGVLAVRLASKITGGDYIYHCQDMHPEIAAISSKFSKSFLYEWLLRIETNNSKGALTTIVLSEDMKQSLLRRKCDDNNICIINNFDLREPIHNKNHFTISEKLIRKENKFRLIFAGNIGRFQGLEYIIEVAKLLTDEYPNIEFIFLGDGKASEHLKQISGKMLNSTVYFFGHQPITIARTLIADSQLALISLNNNIYKYAFPSKTMTYACEGVPLLCIVEQASSLAQLVIKNKIGITSPSSNPDYIAKEIIALYKHPKRLLMMKENTIRYANKHYSIESVMPILINALCERRVN